jgi:hypothetical protein
VFQFSVGRSGTLAFEPGPAGRLVEIIGGQTRVTVEHLGWDGIPQEHAARHGFPLGTFQLRFAQWWQVLLRELADMVIHPEARQQ